MESNKKQQELEEREEIQYLRDEEKFEKEYEKEQEEMEKKEKRRRDEEEEEEQRTLDEKIGERFEVIIDKRNDDYNIGLIVDGKNSQEYLYFYDSYSQKTIITPLKKENEE